MTKTSKCKTPFGPPIWAWNHVPHSGHPTRPRCQEVATDDERKQGAEIISEYRAAEKVSADNNIDSRSEALHHEKGVGAEMLRREISRCDHQKYLEAETKLAELRRKAYDLVEPVLKRVVKSLDDQLKTEALEAEERLTQLGLPIQAPAHLDLAGRHVEGEWSLHSDMLCKAIWSQRVTVQKCVDAICVDTAIGTCQFLCSDEPNVPFSWL
jgi:hypothetical protein